MTYYDRKTGRKKTERRKDRKIEIQKDKNTKRETDEKTEKFERLNRISAVP